MKNPKTNLIIASVCFVLLFAIGAFTYKDAITKSINSLSKTQNELFVRNYSPTLGPIDAKITLVEFLDPECESCRRFYPFVKEILKDNPGKIKLVVRYAPFHKNAKFIIKALEATRAQGKYWESLSILFKYQPYWADHHNPKPELIWSFLPQVGVDVEKAKLHMKDNNEKLSKMIEQEIADGETLSVRATPTFFVNGKPLIKFGYQQLKDAIEAELKK